MKRLKCGILMERRLANSLSRHLAADLTLHLASRQNPNSVIFRCFIYFRNLIHSIAFITTAAIDSRFVTVAVVNYCAEVRNLIVLFF